MRAIKFRAWDNGKMHKVRLNHLYENEHHPSGHIYIRDEMKPFGKNHKTELMQFTGLLDINGVEVYESDIIEDDLGYLAVVKFGEHLTSTDYYASTAYGWYAERANGDTHSLAQCGTITVRGNIHEHPHLLEQTDG